MQGRYSQPHFSAAYFSKVRSLCGGHDVCDQGINGGEGALGNIFSCVVLVLLSLRSRSTEYWTGTVQCGVYSGVRTTGTSTVEYNE